MKSQTQKLFIATVALVMSTMSAGITCAQKPAGASTKLARVHPFEPSEELIYVGEFSRALLKRVDIADFRFTANRERVITAKSKGMGLQKTPAPAEYSLKFTGEVSSRGFFSKLFNLNFRERVESIVEPASFTVQKTKKLDEQGKRARASEAVYDRGKVSWIERDPNNPSRSPRTFSSDFTGQVQDILSAIYYLRTQPLEVGKTFEITISDSGRVYQVPVRVVEQKRMKTVLGRVDALRVDPEVYGPNRLIAGKGHFSIWLTNDSRHIPVSARVKTGYGTFDITLRKVIQNPAPRESLAGTKDAN
jgi:hypothetical protein